MKGKIRSGPQQAGRTVELALHNALGQQHYRPKYDVQMDNTHKVDALIRAGMHEGLPFAAAEIQTTMNLDDRDKLLGYLNTEPVLPCGESVRLYVEIWGQDVAVPAAIIIGKILEACIRDGMPEDPLFLRFGPKGKWFSQKLTDRIKHLDEVCSLGHPDRQNGLMIALAPTHVTVKTRKGKELSIPLRLVLEPTRRFLRSCAKRKGLPREQDRGLSFFPGIPDSSGVPLFFAREGFRPRPEPKRGSIRKTPSGTRPNPPRNQDALQPRLEQQLRKEREELAAARLKYKAVRRETGVISGTDREIIEYLEGKVRDLCRQLHELGKPAKPKSQNRSRSHPTP